MIAVHAALERVSFLFVVLYVVPALYLPAGLAIVDPEFASAMILVVVGTDADPHCGSGGNAVFPNWQSPDGHEPCSRAHELAERVAALGLVITNNFNGGIVDCTFWRPQSAHRCASISAPDLCFVDAAFAEMLTSVVVRADRQGVHFLDPVLSNLDGHRLVTTTALVPVGRQEDAPMLASGWPAMGTKKGSACGTFRIGCDVRAGPR